MTTNSTPTTPTIRQAVKSAARALATADKKVGEARVIAARVTHRAFTEGHIGGESPVWKTQGDYAADLNVSGGQVTGLKRLGLALSLGCAPSDEHWGLLSHKAGTKEVGALVDAEGATPASIYAGLLAAFTPDGKRVTSTTPARAEGEPERETTPAPAQVSVPASVPAMLDMLETLTARLASEPITRAEHKRVAAIVDSLGSLTASKTADVEDHRAA